MIQRTPIRKKRPGVRRGQVIDHKYRAFIRSLGCIVCRDTVPHNAQSSRTEVAHIGERGLGQKCSDYETVPLCAGHHRIRHDSHHQAGKAFWVLHKLDRDQTIAALRKLYEMTGGE